VAAGAFGSPVLLQRSGVGPREVWRVRGLRSSWTFRVWGGIFRIILLLYCFMSVSILVVPEAWLTIRVDFTNPVPNTQTAASNATFAAEVET